MTYCIYKTINCSDIYHCKIKFVLPLKWCDISIIILDTCLGLYRSTPKVSENVYCCYFMLWYCIMTCDDTLLMFPLHWLAYQCWYAVTMATTMTCVPTTPYWLTRHLALYPQIGLPLMSNCQVSGRQCCTSSNNVLQLNFYLMDTFRPANITVIQRLSSLRGKVILPWSCRDHRTCFYQEVKCIVSFTHSVL